MGNRQSDSSSFLQNSAEDYWSPTICFLTQPRIYLSWHCDEESGQLRHVELKHVCKVQHKGSFEAPQHSVLKLEHRKRSQQMILSWTHPSNRHLGCPDEFTIVLSPFVCCGYAKVGDIQAPDLTPKGLPEHFAKVEVEHGFWVHAPERQRTFYFYAKTREEQKEWVNLIRHNLEVFRSHPDASAKILRRCQKTLAEHGYNDKEQARKLNAVKHALRDRRFRQFDRKSDNDEDKIGWATFQGKTDKVAALLIPDDKDEKFDLWAEKAAGEWDVNQCFSADLGGNSLLIEAVKRDATGILLMLLDRKANVDVQNVDGDTALIVASRLGREFAAIHLLHAGADLKIKNRFNEDVKTEATAEIQAVLEEQRTNPDFMTSKFLHTFQMSNRSSLAQDSFHISSAGVEVAPFSASAGPQYDAMELLKDELKHLENTGRMIESPVGTSWRAVMGLSSPGGSRASSPLQRMLKRLGKSDKRPSKPAALVQSEQKTKHVSPTQSKGSAHVFRKAPGKQRSSQRETDIEALAV